ncbi:translocation/assembly module TamB domain-containing protein [Pontibacter sp. KCTC 32443]|uniref:translocation/assembly module TamB domain-containing protein n=1 Tax=Pontibacter TaxID=323449 RepID=UPI00164E162A|nr:MULTISPECIES: translocation/assembly module TamB domain-containing protein [Pontibacter]MBC5774877.1 translocation/assembly module TamB domain-containing protein [Pontibacter sp. KCTC 32443]
MGLFAFLLLLFILVFFAIRIPAVQTKIAQRAATWLSEATNHDVSVGRVDIEFFSNVILERVQVRDYKQNELFYVGRIEADIAAFSILNPNSLSIATLELQEPRANLVYYQGSDTLNAGAFFSALSDLFVKDTTKVSKPFKFDLQELILKNGRFTYDDFNKPLSEHGMDYAHLTVDSIYGHFDELVLADTLKANISNFSAIETRSNTNLRRLDTKMTYSATFWEWADLNLRVQDSHVRDYVRFDFKRFGNFRNFNDSVTMTANLHDSYAYARDISIFTTLLKGYENEEIQINSINYKGKVSNFKADSVDLKYGQNTHIVGSISADGLPNVRETFANLKLQPSTIDADDIKQFLPRDAYEVVDRLGIVKLDGRFLGFYNDFVANGSFVTALGNVRSDINLKIDDDKRSSSYKGFVSTNGFNLGKLINRTDLIQTISMSGKVAGSGFTLEDANVDMDATIRQLYFKNYNYQNIVANGNLSRQKFVGEVSVNDPNLVIAADGEIFLNDGEQAFNVMANLQKVDLRALGLSKDPFTVSANANLDFKGLRLDDFVGVASFANATINYKGKELALDSLYINSEIVEGQRALNLVSDLVTLNLDGNFAYSTLIDDLTQLAEEYKLNFESIDAATQAYYRRKAKGDAKDYALNYTLYLKDANPLLQLFVPDLAISKNTNIEGSFTHGNTVIVNMFGTIDTISYADYNLYRNTFDITSSKLQHSPDVLASIIYTSEQQQLPTAGQTQDFYLEGIWSERKIDFATSVRQPEENNRATITGDLNFLENQIQLVFDKSNIVLRDMPWAFTPGNTIVIGDAGRTINFENFAVTNQEQVVRAAGTISEDPNSRLTLNVEQFDLRNLNTLMTEKIAGTLNGQIVAQDIYNRALLNITARVDSFHLDDFLIGNIDGTANWNNTLKQMVVDVGIDRNNKKVLTVTGNYNPNATEDQLDLLAVMDQAQLKMVEPLIKPILSDLEGDMEGRVRILGRLGAPILKGSVMVSNGQFKFDYLNTTYHFNDRVYLGPNSISFRNAQLKDLFGNSATVTGGIAHDGFENMVIDLSARYRNFMILNTTAEHNELYYGTAFGTGTASILGPVDNLRINVDARSEENTRLVIPLDNQESIARKDFINFVTRTPDSLAVAVDDQKVDLSGINMNFNLDVTDDAYFEIIIDRTTGDVIRGSGSGDIRMTIDTRGDFNMFGVFEISKGAYNLNLLEGLVTREFNVQPGSTITWNGDPLGGIMNITGNYTQMASLPVQETSTLQGRYPITAVIDLDGPLLTPQITLGLNFDQVPQTAETEALTSAIQSDEAELNRQVFSLMVLGRLSPQGTFSTVDAGSTAVGGSLGSLLSGQLSSFLNSIDSNLEIDIGLGNIDQDALSSLQVRLSYSFFQGRLRVTSEAGLGTSNVVGTTSDNSYQGDWSLEYYITKSGELRGRLEYNTIPRGLVDRRTNRQSFSLLHTKRFDNLKELFMSNRRQRRLEEQEREQIILDSDPRLNLEQ